MTAAGRLTVRGALLLAAIGTACEPAAPGPEALAHPREMELPAPGFVRPDPTAAQHGLDNGLTAYVVEDHTVPLVTLTAIVGAGRASDSRQGSAETLAAILRTRGPATRSAGDFRAALGRMVADYSVSQSAEETTIELNVPSEDWPEALGLLADLVMSPGIGDAEVRAAAASLGGSTPGSGGGGQGTRAYDGSLDSAVALFARHLYEGHPFGRAPSPVELRTLNATAVRSFHAATFVPGNVALAVGGDVDAQAVRAALDGAFGPWESRPVPARTDFPPVSSDGERQILTYPVDALQAWLVLGHELPVVPLEEEAALHVMNYVLGGGHFDTRLFRATRDERGLTNDDSGFLEPGVRGPGSYTFRTYGRPEVVPLLLHLTLAEIDRIRSEPVTAEELSVAKGALADGEYTLGFRDGPATAATFAREWLRFGSHDRSATYPERIRAVTADQVLLAAGRYLDPDRLDLVLVGPLSRVRDAVSLEGEPPLESFGTVAN